MAAYKTGAFVRSGVPPPPGGLRPLLFSNNGVGSFTSHKNRFSVIAVRRDLRFFLLMRED